MKPLTEQERLDAFQQAVREAGERYGVEAFAATQPEQLGAVVQVRPVLVMRVREDWAPKDEE
jgi:bifunctional N-acetylglucosamine-1-phosphate-uridyltransferase/glucosamine-1-phosphate-acetyltransferase GlmU-like protein